MTELQTAKLIALLREYYPRDTEASSVKSKVRAWHLVLQDYPYEVGEAAAIAFVANDRKGFMPSPGQIVEQIQLVTNREGMPAQDAWNLVSQAVANTDFMNPSKQFDKLPPEAQRAVGSANMLREWGMVDVDTFNTVIYSNFIRAHDVHKKRQQAMAAIPESVRAVIQGVSDKLMLGGTYDET